MQWFWTLLFLALHSGVLWGQTGRPPTQKPDYLPPGQDMRRGIQQRVPPVITSASRQFLVHSAQAQGISNYRIPGGRDLSKELIELTPQFLAVSCERIKTAILRLLDMQDRWRGRVRIGLFRSSTGLENARITSTFYNDGPQYNVLFPNRLYPEKLIKGMTQVILLEIANREIGVRAAEIPFWLVEGMTRHLMVSDELTLILQPPPPSSGIVLNDNPRIVVQPEVQLERIIVRQNPISEAAFLIKNQNAYSFTELSLLSAGDLNRNQLLLYQASSQVFLHGLLEFNNGKAQLREFLRLLPHFWNWQSAFFQAFNSYFITALDVERWWAVTVTGVLNSNQYDVWSERESLNKLQEVLQVPVQIKEDNSSTPKKDNIPLRTAIEKWEPEMVSPLLRIKIQQLIALELNSSRRISPFLAAYRGLLEDYYRKIEDSFTWEASRNNFKPRLNYLKDKTLEHFDNLEKQRLQHQGIQPSSSGQPPPETTAPTLQDNENGSVLTPTETGRVP